MNLHRDLAIVFGPTLFQTDGKDYTAGRVIEDLIQHYTRIFEVDEQQLKKQLDEITAIIKLRETNINVPIPGSMTAAELTCEILDRPQNSHQGEGLLELLGDQREGRDGKADVSKHGQMKFREERMLGLGGFNERYFILTGNTLRMYKEIRSNRPERDWSVKSLRIYLGIKKKVRPPPSSWGLTMVHQSEKQEKPERQQWYLCCSSEAEMNEWFATFLSIQFDGDVWPVDGVQQRRSTRAPGTDTVRHGNVSLIPLRGSEE
ncbi:hypothetical protein CRUP_036593 [Coryphaenoides rupestris]|nr:hypothetical protein CRUP_036593 [Coryphaenoides rupestris]